MRTWFALAVAALLLAAPIAAQCRLPTSGTGVGAIDGDRAIVSSYSGMPSVTFYERTSQGWETRESSTIGNYFLIYDSPVAIQGTRALAGAPESDNQKGRAFVFDLVGTQWVRTELLSPFVHPADFFGWLVALDGDVAVVGADHWSMGGGDELDRSHVFEFDGSTWSEVAQLTVRATSIDIDGSRIVLGDPHGYPGHVEVYEKLGSSWIWTGRAQEVPPAGGTPLGASVALQGDTLVASGTFTSQEPGYVRVFRLGNGYWNHVQLVLPHDSADDDGFGYSVGLSGSTLLVGAPGRRNGLGKVYRFENDGTRFVETGAFEPEADWRSFGRTVAVGGGDAFLSAYPEGAFYRVGFDESSPFCPTTANSTGAAASLAVLGCDSVAGRSLRFAASALPAGAATFVLFGPGSTAVRFGEGVRCVGTRALRLPSRMADPSGTWVQDVDFEERPGSLLTPGRTWYFQAIYRDHASAGAGINLTNALAVGLTP